MNYTPGQCNIGPAEIARRYRIGYGGLALCVSIILIVWLGDLDRPYRFLMILPAGMMLAGFLQATHKFCLAYGLQGVFSTKGMRQRETITEADALRADRKKALVLIAQVGLGSLLITLLYYFFPW